MKKSLSLAAFVLLTFGGEYAQGQRLTEYEKKAGKLSAVTLTRESGIPDVAYESVREFADEVQQKLRNKYPSRVVDVKVSLSISVKQGKPMWQFWWSAHIVTTEPISAGYYFKQMGALWSADSLTAAKARAAERAEREKVIVGLALSQRHQSYSRMRRVAHAGPFRGRFWAVDQYFVNAGKQSPK